MSPAASARSQMSVPPRLKLPLDAQPGLALDRLRHQLAEDVLLGEVLRADDDRRPTIRARRARPRAARPRPRPRGDGGRGAERIAPPALRQQPLQPQQRAVHGEREQRRRNRAGQDDRRVHHRQAAVDVLAEAAGADRRRDRRRPDADHRRHPDAGDDRRASPAAARPATAARAASSPSPCRLRGPPDRSRSGRRSSSG